MAPLAIDSAVLPDENVETSLPRNKMGLQFEERGGKCCCLVCSILNQTG